VIRKKIGVLAGAFNPVTRAHLALAEAAAPLVDEIVCVVPRIYPHKEFHGAGLEDRLKMLAQVGGPYTVLVSEGGLFIEITRELRADRPQSEIYFICGRDAAERVVNWNYGEPGAVERMFEEFRLLVASRDGRYSSPEHLKHRVEQLALPRSYDEISSTEFRRRIEAGEPWEHLVPDTIVDLVKKVYKAT
jgi:nicotinate-nucleotide adenylyltransferase